METLEAFFAAGFAGPAFFDGATFFFVAALDTTGLAAAFLEATFFADFAGAAFLAAFTGVGFLAAGFFTDDFLAAGFLAAAAFLADTAFLVGDFFEALAFTDLTGAGDLDFAALGLALATADFFTGVFLAAAFFVTVLVALPPFRAGLLLTGPALVDFFAAALAFLAMLGFDAGEAVFLAVRFFGLKAPYPVNIRGFEHGTVGRSTFFVKLAIYFRRIARAA